MLSIKKKFVIMVKNVRYSYLLYNKASTKMKEMKKMNLAMNEKNILDTSLERRVTIHVAIK